MNELQVPVIGGATSVTLTSAATLDSLGVSVSPLGSATVSTTDADPVASFTITGGTLDNAAGGAVILHQGSGLELSDAAGVVDIADLRVDTVNGVINANVSANGISAGNLAVFSLGADAAITLTAAAADVVDQILDTTAITPAVQVGFASVAPIPFLSGTTGGLAMDGHAPSAGSSEFLPIVDGQTTIDLSSAATLASLGVAVSPLGSATIDLNGDQAVGSFGITGGTLNAGGGTAVILHQGSGLMLSDSGGSLALTNFLVDTQNDLVDANVAVNGVSAGNAAVFDIGSDGGLTLTMSTADIASTTLGTQVVTSSTVIGFAMPAPVILSPCYANIAAAAPADSFAVPAMVPRNA